MNIEITAFDTLFFKDGKPFTMGEDTWASGIFPPPPSVFYGMIRTAFASQNNIPLDKIVGDTKQLKIASILLAYDYDYEKQILFPYPADLFQPKETKKPKEDRNKDIKLMKLKSNNIISNIDREMFPYVLSPDTNKKLEERFAKAYLDKFSFEGYLNLDDTQLSIKEKGDIIETESKIGIAKDMGSNQTEEGKLYRVGMLRTKVKFLIEFSGLDLQDESFLKIGAESKAAHYKTVTDIKVSSPEIRGDYIKLYLATPAIFKNGSIPEFISKGNYNGIDLELLTMAIGKPVFIGGFDMKFGKPKPMKKAVPAGSVYYIKCKNANELAQKLHGNSISEINPEQGFGICYCGTFMMD